MKSIKKLMLLAVAAAAVVAFAAPAAQAEVPKWTSGGKVLEADATVSLSGQLTWNSMSGNGGFKCDTESTANLEAETGKGTVTSFTASNCEYFGTLLGVCGPNDVTTVTGTPGSVQAETDGRIAFSGIAFKTEWANPVYPQFCPKEGLASTSQGTVLTTLDSQTAMTEVTVSGGSMMSTLGEMIPSGTLAVTPAGSYGIDTSPPEIAKWTEGGKGLKKDATVDLAGRFSWNDNPGLANIICGMESTVTLKAGTDKGSLTSFTGNDCEVYGALATVCGTDSVTTFTGLPWSVKAQKDGTFVISGFMFETEWPNPAIPAFCPPGLFASKGTLVITPDSSTAMTEAEISGGTISTTAGSMTPSGELTVKPAGLYGF